MSVENRPKVLNICVSFFVGLVFRLIQILVLLISHNWGLS